MSFADYNNTRTECDGCGKRINLNIVDVDGVLIGGECECGYYTTRYMPGMKPKGL